MNEEQMYAETIARLARRIEFHKTPSGRSSQRAFAEAYGYDRENLRRILAGQQGISVGLFLKLAATVGGKEAPKVPDGLDRWSLSDWLALMQDPVHRAMYAVCFGEE